MSVCKEALKNVPLFSDLTDKELGVLAESGSRRVYPGKALVFQEGELGEVLLVILSGTVKVVLLGKHGEEFILTTLGSGNFFGEMSILEVAPRSATVMTVEPCEFFLLWQKDLEGLISKRPAILMKVLKHLSQRLRQTTELIRSLVMYDVVGRVGRCLLNLAEQHGRRADGQLLVPDRPSFQELANMVGCSRESLSRTIKALKDNGCISVTRRTIYLHKNWQ